MAGKKKATIPDAVPVMSNTRRRSSARKNKAFQMLQRDMEQVTCGQKIYGHNTMPVSSFIRARLTLTSMKRFASNFKELRTTMGPRLCHPISSSKCEFTQPRAYFCRVLHSWDWIK